MGRYHCAGQTHFLDGVVNVLDKGFEGKDRSKTITAILYFNFFLRTLFKLNLRLSS